MNDILKSGYIMIEANLTNVSQPVRLLFTGFLLVTLMGLYMAGFQIMETHGKADGQPGLSVNDIVYSYYGNRSGSKLEAMLNGQMEPMAPDEVRFKLIQWAREGASIKDWLPEIKPIMEQYDEGASIASLTRVSHIHLFGISFIFLFVGWIFAMANFPVRWKMILIATPFVFLLLDVLSWWLTKFFPVFAWLTMLGGVGSSLASIIMIVTSLGQMWMWELIQRRH